MNFFEAINRGKIFKGSYYIYVQKNGKRISYVDQLASARKIAEDKFIAIQRSKGAGVRDISHLLTPQQKQVINESINLKDVVFFQREEWVPNKGWVLQYKGIEPDAEIYHFILTADWGVQKYE